MIPKAAIIKMAVSKPTTPFGLNLKRVVPIGKKDAFSMGVQLSKYDPGQLRIYGSVA